MNVRPKMGETYVEPVRVTLRQEQSAGTAVTNAVTEFSRAAVRPRVIFAVATALGFFSGFLLYLIVAMLHSADLAFLALGWIVSALLLHQSAASTPAVLSRGFLTGVIQWLLVLVIGVIHGAQSGLFVRVGILAAVSVVMTLACLGGFLIVHYKQRASSLPPAQPRL